MPAKKDKKQIVWRSIFAKQTSLIDGSKYILHYETVLFRALAYSVPAFVGAVGASWLINVSWLPRPPGSDFIGHIGYWAAMAINKLTFHWAFAEETHKYMSYLGILNETNSSYIIGFRQFLGQAAAIPAAVYGAWQAIQNPRPASQEIHTRGTRLFENEEAERMLAPHLQEEIERSGSFAPISELLCLSEERRCKHTIIIGASGTGKSQLIYPQIGASISQGLKTFVLDPKFEFTASYYKDDGSMAIIDPTDIRSHVWDIGYDLKKLGLMKKFAAGMIPQGGDNPMWSDAARTIFVGLLVFLRKQYKETWTWSDLSSLITISSEEFVHIIQEHYPEALDLVGKIEDGQVETNVTHEGIKINFKTFMSGIRDIARFWYKPEQPRFSLYEFMTNPHYPIKTLFLKPNANEGIMGKMLMQAMTTYAISFMDSPLVPDSDVPVGHFFLDEFHAPGKLLDETSTPVINKVIQRGRSKRWGLTLAVQNLVDLYQVYTREDVEGWRETSSTFILTGAPLGKTAQEVADSIGEQFIDKLHTSITNQSEGSSSSINYQEHNKKVILPSEIASKLTPKKTYFRYLALFRGIEDVYIINKPYVDMSPVCEPWIEQDELDTAHDPNARVYEAIRQLMEKHKKPAGPSEPPPDASSTGGGRADIPKWVPVQEESALAEDDVDIEYVDDPNADFDELLAMATNTEERKEIFRMPEEEDVMLQDEIVKHMGTEQVFHSASLSAAKEVVDVIAENQKAVTTDKNKLNRSKQEKEKNKREMEGLGLTYGQGKDRY
ncbi:Type IV secretory pathway VirD4 components-like protein [Caballeronia peredens]|nr:Type IV secretory pathway VirD4 components-like protein [Caballeronia peredens]